MTNEKLNKLRNAIKKAGKCDIVRVAIDGHTLVNFIILRDVVLKEYNSQTYMRLCTSEFAQLHEIVWFEDNRKLSYDFICEVSGENPKTVTYCNGKITTAKG